MTIDQERTYIMQHPKYKRYANWQAKVMRMPDSQVHAIYKQFQKLDYRKIEREIKAREQNNQKYHQITIFEYAKEVEEHERN